MMEQSVVAVFDDRADAQSALDALLADGFSVVNARITSSEGSGSSLTSGQAGRHDDDSLGDKIARFFGFDDDEYEETYSEAVRRGHYVLQVDAIDSDEAARAQQVISRFSPVDIDKKSTEWRESGWAPRTAGTSSGLAATGAVTGSTGEVTIPVTEERLAVGKREIQTGGVRVITRTVQKPVEAEVSLREEHAVVSRRPVDRAVTDADRAFEDQSIEVRESAEEAVVGKTARVVEEVRVGKESSTREETVRDTVRKTEVDVQQIGTARADEGGTGGLSTAVPRRDGQL
jgi:uncharacterized protein (TIGR02271 family)